MKRLRANTLKDHWDFLLHIGVTGGIAAGAFFALGFPPILTGLAIAGTLGIKFGLGPMISRAMHKAISEERSETDLNGNPRKHPLARKIEGWVEEFTRRLDLDQTPQSLFANKTHPVYGDKGLTGIFRNMLREEYNKKANAFAFKHEEHGSVVVNGPIARELDERELRGVVAHEVGHIAAGHHVKRDFLSYLSTPAILLTGLNAVVTTFSSWKNFGLFYAANVIGGIAGGLVKIGMGLDEEIPQEKEFLKNTKSVVRNLAIAGLSVAFGAPDMLLAQGLNYFTTKALSLSGKHYSRRKEFQADRIAAELTGDPGALSDGLHRIMDHYKRDNLDYKPQKMREDNMITKVFERIADIGKTHPNVYRRSEKLLGMNGAPFDIA